MENNNRIKQLNSYEVNSDFELIGNFWPLMLWFPQLFQRVANLVVNIFDIEYSNMVKWVQFVISFGSSDD